MKPVIIDCKSGRLIINALRTGEISVTIDCGRGTMGLISTPGEAAEMSIGLIAAIKTAKP